MKRWLVILLAVFCIGAALFFLRNGTDPVVKKKPSGPPVAVPRAAPFGDKLSLEKTKETASTPTPAPRTNGNAEGTGLRN